MAILANYPLAAISVARLRGQFSRSHWLMSRER
jgi:hypothetical protein